MSLFYVYFTVGKLMKRAYHEADQEPRGHRQPKLKAAFWCFFNSRVVNVGQRCYKNKYMTVHMRY